MIVSATTKRLAESIQRGDYEVDEQKVADAILNRSSLTRALDSVFVSGKVDGGAMAPEFRRDAGSRFA
jgi:hypothetical protein